jgi:hypothetical protein
VTEQPRDLARYLPLSQRPQVDESAVSNDWASRLDDLEAAVAAVGAVDRTDFDAALANARGRRRVRVPDLGRALVAAYELDERVTVEDAVSGAVALARLLTAPLPIRAVARGRTLVATDAGWRLGTGPELTGTARELVLFLYGKAGVPGS